MEYGTLALDDPPVINTGFVCELCLKVFDRNDLLSRHKRRCKDINRSSKRKACAACVRTKSKCCFTHPSCHRCVKRGKICEYPPSHSNEPSNLNQTVPQTIDIDVLPNPAERLSDLDWIFDFEMVDQLPYRQINEHPTPNNSLFNQAPPLNTRLELASFAPSNNQRSDVSDRSDMKTIEAGMSPGMGIGMEHQNGFFMDPSLPDRHLDTVSYPYASFRPRSTNAQRTGTPRPRLINEYPSLSNAGQEKIPDNVTYISSQRPLLTVPSPEDSTDRLYHTDQESSDDSHFPASSSLSLASTPSSSIGTAAQQISNTKDLLSIVNSYSNLLLQDDYRSPFIHRKLNSGSYSDMSVMAKSGMAVCCAAAYENESSAKFVSKFITTERERLVHTFHRYSCVEEWDALHAMCIYQIIELLNSREEKNAESGMKAAELHIPFLLKMTRQFCRNHPSANQSDDALEVTWQRWLVAETVRRTVFLVNIINVLAGHDNGRPSRYYEPLNDSIIFRMPLPAPDALWESRTAEAWQAARDQLGRETPTIQTLLMDNREEITRDIPQIGRPGLSDSLELTNLILHCHMYHHSTFRKK